MAAKDGDGDDEYLQMVRVQLASAEARMDAIQEAVARNRERLATAEMVVAVAEEIETEQAAHGRVLDAWEADLAALQANLLARISSRRPPK